MMVFPLCPFPDTELCCKEARPQGLGYEVIADEAQLASGGQGLQGLFIFRQIESRIDSSFCLG